MKFFLLSGIISSILLSTVNAYSYIEDDCTEIRYHFLDGDKCIMDKDGKVQAM